MTSGRFNLVPGLAAVVVPLLPTPHARRATESSDLLVALARWSCRDSGAMP